MTKTVDVISDLAAMSEVLSARLPMLALAMTHSTPARRLEAERMVLEKRDAAVDGFFSLQKYCFASVIDVWRMPVDNDPIRGAMEAYLAPARATLHENAKRFRGQIDV